MNVSCWLYISSDTIGHNKSFHLNINEKRSPDNNVIDAWALKSAAIFRSLYCMKLTFHAALCISFRYITLHPTPIHTLSHWLDSPVCHPVYYGAHKMFSYPWWWKILSLPFNLAFHWFMNSWLDILFLRSQWIGACSWRTWRHTKKSQVSIWTWGHGHIAHNTYI